MVVAFLIANYLFSVPLKAVHIQNHHFYLFFTFPNWGFSSTCRCSSRRGCTCTWGSAGFGHLDFRGCRKGWRVRSLGMVLNEPFWWTMWMEFWWCFVCCGCAAECHISLIDMILQEIIEDNSVDGYNPAGKETTLDMFSLKPFSGFKHQCILAYWRTVVFDG